MFSSSEIIESEVKWSKTFGGSGNEEGYYILSTDAGCIALGYTGSYESKGLDIYLVKINEDGIVEWEQNYGGIGDDYGKAIIMVNDGYIIAGTSNSTGVTDYDYNAWLLKVDFNGDILWNQSYGGIYEDGANSIVESQDGNYTVTGFTYSYDSIGSDMWIFKVNKTGEIIWNKIYGGEGFDEGRSIVETNDGYVIAGETSFYSKSQDYTDAWLLKVDTAGNHVWNKTFDGAGYDDLFNHIIETDSGFISVGHARDRAQTLAGEYYSKGYIVITNENGQILAERVMEEERETGISSIAKTDGGYIVTGYIGQYGAGDGNITVEKIENKNGERVWLKEYGGDYSDAGVWIDRGSGDNYFVTGYQDLQGDGLKDLWIAKLELE
jgi:hypothetical protein